MFFRFLSRHVVLSMALILCAFLPPRAWGKDGDVLALDLQPFLCPLELQQPNNDPSAGVDFVSEQEVLVYTVCRVGAGLSTRNASDPGADAPNHLKAVLLDLTSGNVIRNFDWPTRGRGATVRVTHQGELIVQTDNLLRTVTLEGKTIAAIRLVKVGQGDLTFVNLSPASDTVAVIQSSQADGKTVNGVAVLDAHKLEPKAQWHDDAESWNIAVSGDSAVRTQGSGTKFQMIDLGKASDANTDWNTVWTNPTDAAARPVFLGENRFAFATNNSVVLFSAPRGNDRKDIDCINALGVRASRDGGLAMVCVLNTSRQAGSHGRIASAQESTVEVYRANPLRKLGSADLPWTPGEGFDFALSPSAARVAVVDQLRLKVYTVREKAIEPPTPPTQVATAQEPVAPPPPPPSPGTPVIQSTTRLVQVDVVVTDSHSHPVTDLTAPDFTVLENGKPQKVTFFSYESPEKKVDSTPPPSMPVGTVTNRPDPRQASPVVILLLDGLNTPSTQQLYVRQQMLKYLTELKASNARMAVLALGSDLSVLQDFTTDLASLQTAVKNYKRGRTKLDVDTPGIDLSAAGGGGGSVGAPVGAQIGGSLPGVQDLLDLFSNTVASDEQDIRIRTTIAALQAIAQSVTGYSGRKSLIWMSYSFPFTLGFDNDNPISHFANFKEYSAEIHKTTALLTDANVAVYPVDTRGLASGGGVADVTISATSPDKSGVPSTDLSKEVFTNFRTEETENTVADQTGGKVFRNTNDLKGAIQAAVEDSTSYYVLGYYLDQRKMDGKFHTIQVKVSRDGTHVRSRTGYFALDANEWQKRDQKARSSVLSGLAATGVLMVAHPVEPKASGQPAVIEILVDTSTISFGSNPDGTHAVDLSFEVASLKPDGRPEHVETSSATADVKDTTYQQFVRTGIPMKMNMPLTTGKHLLRVTVRDNRTGHVGSVDAPLTVR